MTKERNALAERLEIHSEYLCGNNEQASNDVILAQRIIAELAKVGFLKTIYGELVTRPSDACEAVDKCRAIADEGV